MLQFQFDRNCFQSECKFRLVNGTSTKKEDHPQLKNKAYASPKWQKNLKEKPMSKINPWNSHHYREMPSSIRIGIWQEQNIVYACLSSVICTASLIFSQFHEPPPTDLLQWRPCILQSWSSWSQFARWGSPWRELFVEWLSKVSCPIQRGLGYDQCTPR